MSRGSITKNDILYHIMNLRYRVDTDLKSRPEVKKYIDKYLNELLYNIEEYTY